MDIRERQNSERSRERLVAQRWLYSRVKKLEGWRLGFLVIVALLALTGLAVNVAEFSRVATVVVVLLWGVDQSVLIRCAERKKEEAAAIQEDFDCFVLDLPWAEYNGVVRPTDDRVRELERMPTRRSKVRKGLADWYGRDDIPDDAVAARLHCQRTNCRWDQRLRREWICFVQLSAGSVVAAGLVAASLRGVSLLQAVLVAAAGLRLLAWLVMEVRAQSAAKTRVEALHGFLSRAGAQTGGLTLCDVRLVQARLFEHRRLSPTVPDWFYWRRKPAHETMERC